MDSRISMITLGVRDLPVSIALCERLGLPRKEWPSEEVAFFHQAGTESLLGRLLRVL